MKQQFKNSDFPMCFLAVRTGIYYGYCENGIGIMVSRKEGHIMKTDYHQKLNTKEFFLKDLEKTFNHTVNGQFTHQRISSKKFDEILDETLKLMFGEYKGEFLLNIEDVKKAHNFEFNLPLNLKD